MNITVEEQMNKSSFGFRLSGRYAAGGCVTTGQETKKIIFF